MCVANHGHGDVSHQHNAFQGRGLPIDFGNVCFYFIRVRPVASDDVGSQTILLHGISVLHDGIARCTVCGVVYDDGKSGWLCLRRCFYDCLCLASYGQQQTQGKESYFHHVYSFISL